VKRISRFITPLAPLLLTISALTVAQQQRSQGQLPIGSTSSKPATGSVGTARRGNRVIGPPAIPIIERDFEEALGVIEGNYVSGRKLDYNSLFKSSVIGMLRSLDPHSNFYDPQEFEELKTDQRSEYFGIGASIQSYTIAGDLDTYITSTFDGSPAFRGGLRFGDRIVEVDGVKMTGKQSIEVRDKIRGPRGSVVKITVERAADRRMQLVTLTRDAVPQPSVPDSYMIKHGVGYIDMTRGFNYTTTEELEDALARLHERGMQSLVLDLRGNPGGFLDQAIRVAQVFLPSGQLILTQKGRNGFRDNEFHSRNPSPDLIPLVILVNGNTASASEIVAGAMQDHDRALIVGTTSFGKGLVQSIIPLEYGAGLTLTSAKYYTPSGRLIQRDYSSAGFYDYYTHGGLNQADETVEEPKPNSPAKKTDTGRAVYGGGGIAPDETVKANPFTPTQRRLLNPIFGFSRELASGRILGLENLRVQGPLNFNHELTPTDFPVNEAIFQAFRQYVMQNANFRLFMPTLDHNRSFIETQLRFNLVTANYGRVAADRVLVATYDPQVARALDALPRARNLAMSARQQR
jgi:carboxyl-terminal processing protease